MKQPKQPMKTRTKKTPVTTTHQNHSMQEALHQHIAQRAYEIYERRTRKGALDDWLEAEREILQERPHRGGYAGVEQE
jgi:outer membrane protein TolC